MPRVDFLTVFHNRYGRINLAIDSPSFSDLETQFLQIVYHPLARAVVDLSFGCWARVPLVAKELQEVMDLSL
jgi:hypothetical protein